MQKLLYSFLFLCFVCSCKKSLDANIELSTFTDIEINRVQGSGSAYYVLKSKIELNPNQKINEYGFVYSYKNTVFDEIFKDSLKIFYTYNGIAEQSKNFEDTIYHMALNVDYVVKTYSKNEGRITFGNEVKVTPPLSNFQKIDAPLFTDGAVNPFVLSNGTNAIIGGGKNNRLYTKLTENTTYSFSATEDTLPSDMANEYCTTFTLGNYGYVVGGKLNGIPSNLVYRYNFANNTWTKMNDFPGGVRVSAVSAVVENKAFLGFGAGNSNAPADWWKYDEVSDTWNNNTSNLPADIKGRTFASSFVIGKNVYIVGGSETADVNNPIFQNNLWQFNAEKNEWNVLTNCPFKSGRCFSFNFKDEGYLGFGNIESSFNLIVGYNEKNEKWFGYYDGAQGALSSSSRAVAFRLNEKYLVTNLENNEILLIK